MDWINQNKEWLFSGLGVTVLVFLGNLFLKKQNEVRLNPIKIENSPNKNSSHNSNIVNINLDNNPSEANNNLKKTKADIQILFIDDEKFDIVGILKDADWPNTKTIKDVKNLDCLDVKNANVIFVDVNGVGCSLFPNDQGLGLAEAIKSRNPDKYIIIYSAQEHRLHKAFSIVDAVLPKNADPYEFINILENYLRK